jgi:hypothetical protein
VTAEDAIPAETAANAIEPRIPCEDVDAGTADEDVFPSPR